MNIVITSTTSTLPRARGISRQVVVFILYWLQTSMEASNVIRVVNSLALLRNFLCQMQERKDNVIGVEVVGDPNYGS